MRVYLDHSATTKISDRALEVMIDSMQNAYGNPSSAHRFGQAAKTVLENARFKIADLLGAEPGEIYFTSGGTESDNQALYTAAKIGEKLGKKHIISTQIEHHGILHTLKKLEKEGFLVTLLPVDADGLIKICDLEASMREDTCLVSVMYANNEIGVIQPIQEIGALCREKKVLFHTDAVQAAGHIPIQVKTDHLDMMSISAHKFHGPKGVGALYVRKGIEPIALLEGGGQERGKRSGTEAVGAIAGMAEALKEACEKMEQTTEKILYLRKLMLEELSEIEGCIINGSMEKRLPGNLNLSFPGVEGETLVLMLSMKGIAVSSGSACTTNAADPSHVVRALGRSVSEAKSALRISIGEENTEEEIRYAAEMIKDRVSYLRQFVSR